MEMIDYFKGILIISLFYAFAITTISYNLPDGATHYVDMFSDVSSNNIDTEAIVSDSLSRQTNLPLIELGAIVFYSGNILIDLLLNFMTAIPQMVTILINGTINIFPVPVQFSTRLIIFTQTLLGILYLVGIIQLLTNIRSGRAL